MSYFPSFGPFYDPVKEQEVYRENDGSLTVRSRPLTPSGASVSSARRLEAAGNPLHRNAKLECGWWDHVRSDQGDVFYIDVDGKRQDRGRCVTQPDADSHSPPSPSTGGSPSQHSEGCHSNSAVVPPRLLRGSGSEEDEEEKLRSRAELRKKSKQLQQVLRKKQDTLKNGRVKPARHYRSMTASHADPDVTEENNSRLLLSQSAGQGQASQSHNGASQPHSNAPPHYKEVVLVPDFSRRTDAEQAGGAELFELLLGIVLCRYRQRTAGAGAGGRGEVGEGQGESKEGRLVVQGVVTGSPADRSASVHRGDMLLYLNGQELTWSNLHTIVHTVKREVKLTFQVPKIIGPTACSQTSGAINGGAGRLPAYHNLCLLVTGRHILHLQQQLLQHHCVALYLTLSGSAEEQSPHDDIVYCFPPQEESLTAIRGLFLTLSSSLQDIVQCGANRSALTVAGEKINVVYHQQGRDIFVMAVPDARVPVLLLSSLMRDMCRMLTTVFGGVDRAFHGGDSSQLDQVFALFFHRLLGAALPDASTSSNNSDSSNNSPAEGPWAGGLWSQLGVEGVCAAPLLSLSEDNRLICDEVLSEFEAADFDDFLEDSELYLRRSFTILGASLFFKKYLVCSHLQERDLADVYLFLRCHSLLTLASSQPIDELVVWQEVHLTGRLAPSAMETKPIGYQEPAARWFMLVVGMKSFLLATLLEAGGCSRTAVGRPGPPPLLVDQARATLVQLDSQDIHMSACCHHRLTEEVDSAVTTGVERFVTHTRQSKDDTTGVGKSSVTSKPPSPGRGSTDVPFKYRSSPRADRRPDSETGGEGGVMTRQGSKLSYGSNDSGGSGSSTGAPKSKTGRFSSLLDISSIGRSMSALHIDTIGTPTAHGKLSRGRDNVLFHFIHYNDLEGVLVTPTDLDLPLSPGSIQSEVMANFHRCVLTMHAVFRERSSHDSKETGQLQFERDCAISKTVEEQGVLFQCPPSPPVAADHKVSSLLTYWVVGRRFSCTSTRQELYVCFHESCPQSLVELAFTMGFGC